MWINRWSALIWISLAELFGLSLWFSASAILPELTEAWDLNQASSAWVTSAVQIGFIVGALGSSFLGLPDRYNSRKIFAISALLGALLNGVLFFVSEAWLGIMMRFLTGVTLAGVYPTAVKLISMLYPNQRGMAIGVLIAALTLGSAFPHFLVSLLGGFNWRGVIMASSVLSLFSAGIMYWFVHDCSIVSKKSKVNIRLIRKVIQNRKVMLANYGYFGHMWELYAMWTWLPAFLTGIFKNDYPQQVGWYSALASFIIIGIAGAIGCIAGGALGEKIGKERLTIVAMIISAGCAIFVGFASAISLWLTLIVALIWGLSVIADSAQFSALVTEHSEDDYVGTALTFQMAIGFIITVVSINLLPVIQNYIGWERVFIFLSIGPILGVISMLKLQSVK
ncbi:MFS transporter [Pseudoneobacillus sp. C159]